MGGRDTIGDGSLFLKAVLIFLSVSRFSTPLEFLQKEGHHHLRREVAGCHEVPDRFLPLLPLLLCLQVPLRHMGLLVPLVLLRRRLGSLARQQVGLCVVGPVLSLRGGLHVAMRLLLVGLHVAIWRRLGGLRVTMRR